MTEVKIKTLNIAYRDISLEIRCFFRNAGPQTLVYLHGLGCSKNDFLEAANVEELSSYTLLAFDFPGCGDAPYPDRQLSIDDLIEITNLVGEKLKLNPFTLIGHSMGGVVALLYAKKFPTLVTSLINVEGNLEPEDCFWSRQAASIELSEFQNTFFDPLKIKLQVSKNFAEKEYAKSLELTSLKAYLDYSSSLINHCDYGNLLQEYMALNVPKIFIYGLKNENSLSYLKALKESGNLTSIITNSGHFPFYDHPKEYYQTIARFLKTKVTF